MDILEALDALDDLLHKGRAVPMTTQVRLEPEEVDPLLATLRAETLGLAIRPQDSLWTLIEELERVWRDAPGVPLSSTRRVEKERVYDLLDRLRATLPEAIRQQRWRDMPQIDVAAADAPGLADVVDLLHADAGRNGILLTRDGEHVATLRRE